MKSIREVLPGRAKPERHTGRNITLLAAGLGGLAAAAWGVNKLRQSETRDQIRAMAAGSRDRAMARLEPLTDRITDGARTVRNTVSAMVYAPTARAFDFEGGADRGTEAAPTTVFQPNSKPAPEQGHAA